MQDSGHVSTDDTLERRDMNVLTEENISAPAAPAPKDKEQSQTKGKSAEPSDKDETKPKRNRGREREVRRLRRDLADSETRNTELGTKLSSLEQTVDELVAAKEAPAKKPAPKLRDFDGDEKEFGEAYAAWAAEPDPKAKAKAKPKAKQPEKRPTTDGDPFEDERLALMESGEELYGDDFKAAMSAKDPVPVSFNMRDYLFEHPETGADVFMYLDDNRDQARKIANMGAQRAEREMAKIAKEVTDNPPDREGTIKMQDDDDDPKPKKKARSKQPEPPDTVKTTPKGGGDPNMETNSMDDYARVRRKQMADERLR